MNGMNEWDLFFDIIKICLLAKWLAVFKLDLVIYISLYSIWVHIIIDNLKNQREIFRFTLKSYLFNFSLIFLSVCGPVLILVYRAITMPSIQVKVDASWIAIYVICPLIAASSTKILCRSTNRIDIAPRFHWRFQF